MGKKKEAVRNVIVAIGVDIDDEKRCDICNLLDEARGYCILFEEYLTAETLHKTCESCGHEEEMDICLRCTECINSEVELQE